jgi:Tol biopolymer transport system component
MLSPDGSRVVRNNTTGPNRDVWIEDLVHRTSTRLTNSSDNFGAIWSNDGKWVAFARGAPVSNIYRRPVGGGDVEERLTETPKNQRPSSFSPDGASIAYTEFDPVSGSDIWIVTLPAALSGAAATASDLSHAVAGAAARPFVKTNFSEGNAVFSVDGRWLAYQSNDSGRFEIYVRSFPEGAKTLRVSTDGGMDPMWSPTGREIFYRGADGKMMASSVDTAPDFQAGKPRVLFDATPYDTVYSVSPDGRRLLMMALIATEQSATQVHLVLNFISELRQRVR